MGIGNPSYTMTCILRNTSDKYDLEIRQLETYVGLKGQTLNNKYKPLLGKDESTDIGIWKTGDNGLFTAAVCGFNVSGFEIEGFDNKFNFMISFQMPESAGGKVEVFLIEWAGNRPPWRAADFAWENKNQFRSGEKLEMRSPIMKGGKTAAKAIIEVEEFNGSYPDASCKVKAGLVLFDL